MNNKQVILDFLKDLNSNNSEWMDENRDRYTTARNIGLRKFKTSSQCFVSMIVVTAVFNPNCISRITNNRIFNPNLPIYKDFSISP
jgi:hypothetical protein